MKFRWVGRWDAKSRVLRLCRATGIRGKVGDGLGYSFKASLAFAPRLFSFRREYQSWLVIILGVRIHVQRAFGGIFD